MARPMLLPRFMQLVRNKIPEPRLLVSMDPDELGPVTDGAKTPAPIGTPANQRTRPPVAAFLCLGVLILSTGAVVCWQSFGGSGQEFLPKFIKARTDKLATAGANESAPVITIQLSTDMVRVSAIALGHPRLAVINGKTVSEGDSVTLQAPTSSVALTLRVVKIADGLITFSDGKKLFSAQLNIPSPPKPKAL